METCNRAGARGGWRERSALVVGPSRPWASTGSSSPAPSVPLNRKTKRKLHGSTGSTSTRLRRRADRWALLAFFPFLAVTKKQFRVTSSKRSSRRRPRRTPRRRRRRAGRRARNRPPSSPPRSPGPTRGRTRWPPSRPPPSRNLNFSSVLHPPGAAACPHRCHRDRPNRSDLP